MNGLEVAVKAFLDEAKELLDDIEETLLELESNPEDQALVARAFRAMHTIKGSGAMFGYEEIARFTHDLETTYDRVREGCLSISKELLSLTFEAKDHIGLLLAAPPEGDAETRAASDEILARFRAFVAGESAGKSDTPACSLPVDACGGEPEADSPSTFWIRFKPGVGIYRTGTNPFALFDELEALGTCAVVFHGEAIPYLEDYVPDDHYGYWDILITTDKGEASLLDVFIFQEEEEYHVALVYPGSVRASDLEDLAGLVQSHAEEEPEAILRVLEDEILGRLNKRIEPCQETAVEAPAATHAPSKSSIRVDSERLDALVDMVGEMVIIQSRLAQAVQGNEVPSIFHQVSEELERLTDEMRDNALGLRMLPVGTMFNSLRRLVRDLSGSLGKDVNFITEGAETELDKTVIDQLKDPLVHILRNSMDHGIESPETRTAAGKPAQGVVRLSARHSSGNVVITIEDDGKGLDPEKIREKAVSRGLISADAELGHKETLELIFEPGFSTAEKVTDVSGRGVGMDVVRRSIEGLRGIIEISSTAGQGTRLNISLPLTLAIIDGFNVLIEDESYIVPLNTLRGFQERQVEGEVRTLETMVHMEHMIPCVSLRKLLDVPGNQPEYERVVIIEVDGRVVGLSVDQVVGRQQAVIKSLGDMSSNVQWISGTTVNGDGTISVILDIPQLVRFASDQKNVVAAREVTLH
ncbi:chemotaxis protein CheA [Oceanidesulfovibrio marinus]|uniref:Chemotaxis protein CheA n=1 Tax=Oceanidesulfovibrio marinus TaxID=370038 RepID=A0ABX6NHJ2_9BACT|nr:chemotaxis protein CheA [Oceanidesulfovibrio marinus]QJT09533.1 chemotaxis protein CheA [Oceanidesulfovibrio marinus]